MEQPVVFLGVNIRAGETGDEARAQVAYIYSAIEPNVQYEAVDENNNHYLITIPEIQNRQPWYGLKDDPFPAFEIVAIENEEDIL